MRCSIGARTGAAATPAIAHLKTAPGPLLASLSNCNRSLNIHTHSDDTLTLTLACILFAQSHHQPRNYYSANLNSLSLTPSPRLGATPVLPKSIRCTLEPEPPSTCGYPVYVCIRAALNALTSSVTQKYSIENVYVTETTLGCVLRLHHWISIFITSMTGNFLHAYLYYCNFSRGYARL